MKKIAFWFKNARYASLPQSLMPAVTAAVMMIGKSDFSLVLTILAIVGVGFAHLGFNLLDDLFDYISHKTGYRDTLARAGFRAFTAKCPYMTNGETSVKELAAVCGIFGLCACVCGGIILTYRGFSVVIIVLITAFLGYFYSGKPFRFSYHGLGEPVIGIIFGVLNMCGVAISAAGEINEEIVLMGIIMGLLVTNILYTHSVLDYAADQTVGKKTLAAFFKTDKGRENVQGVLMFAPYVIVAGGIISGEMSLFYGLIGLTIPMSLALRHSMQSFLKHQNGDVEWKKWYGPCGDWETMKKLQLTWFLQRWLLARNLVSLTAVLCCVGSILEKVV